MTIPQHAPADPHLTPAAVRQLCRENRFYSGGTPGYAPGYAQANVIILPAQYAEDFRLLCQRNPVPCPLLGWTEVGDPTVPKFLAVGSDIRTDCAKYNLYENGKLVDVKKDISDEWKEDSVAFFIGCSYSFEDAMVKAGLGLRHVETSRILPVYKTTVPLMPAGVFSGRMVVSMRPYLPMDIPLIQRTCRPFIRAHGEPVGWGADGARALGIEDVEGQSPTWGDPAVFKPGEIPVYWGCGVTPQQVVMDSKLPVRVISHSPGFMLVCDMKSEGTCA